jgi:uncharacterized Zn finger protein
MESLLWTFEGEEAEELMAKLAPNKEPRQLVTGSRHKMADVRKTVVKNARKRKVEQEKLRSVISDD